MPSSSPHSAPAQADHDGAMRLVEVEDLHVGDEDVGEPRHVIAQVEGAEDPETRQRVFDAGEVRLGLAEQILHGSRTMSNSRACLLSKYL